MLTSAQLSQLLDLTRKVAEDVGTFIEKERLHFSMDRVEHKGFNDLVSYVDKEAEQQCVSRLQEIFPEAGFITEEGTNTTQGETYNWVIDPLDGTTNFIHGLPVFAESIGFEPMHRLLDDSLANCSFNHSGNSPNTIKHCYQGLRNSRNNILTFPIDFTMS